MQPLGLSKDEYDQYLARLMSSHDFEIDVDVLSMEERVLDSIRPQFLDGQVNLVRDASVRRTATMRFYDPDRSLRFDSDSPFSGGLFANRMIRYRHGVDLTGVGTVWATPFVGIPVKATRDGDEISVECQDKTLLALEGTLPMLVKKGRNAVDAIEDVMRRRTGERRFRFPRGVKKRLTKSYKVGWKAESSPWRVCQKIAGDVLNMQLFYACDGALVLRRRSEQVAADLTGLNALTGLVAVEFDVSELRNYVRVTGDKKRKVGAQAPKKQKHDVSFTESASPGRSHPLSPQSLGRHDVNRYLPLLIDDSSIKKHKVAQDRADKELAHYLSMTARAAFTGVPLFHLDSGDLVRVDTEQGVLKLPFNEASIPLGLGGDAAFGAQRQVSKPRRTG